MSTQTTDHSEQPSLIEKALKGRILFERIGLIDIFGIITILVVLYREHTAAGDPGVGWHLRAGELMLETGQVLRNDSFLFTSIGKPWIVDQWLSEIVFAFSRLHFGWTFLMVFVTAVLFAAHYIIQSRFLYSISRTALIPPFIVLASTLLSVVQWIIRPVVFSFLFFSLLYAMLYLQFEDKKKQDNYKPVLWSIPFLFLVWANFHPAFLLGLVCLLLSLIIAIVKYVFGSFSGKHLLHLSAVFIFSCLTPLSNPYGPDLYQAIFSLMGDDYFLNLNSEWQSIDYYIFPFFPHLFTVVFLCICILRGKLKNVNVFGFFTAAAFLLGSIHTVRYIPFFAFAVAPLLLHVVEGWYCDFVSSDKNSYRSLRSALNSLNTKEGRASRGLYSHFVLLIFLLSAMNFGFVPYGENLNHGYPSSYPHKAVAYINNIHGKNRILNHTNWGGFLTDSLKGDKLIFIDDRNQLVDKVLYQQHLDFYGGIGDWKQFLKDYEIDLILSKVEYPINYQLDKSILWMQIYRDNEYVIYQKDY